MAFLRNKRGDWSVQADADVLYTPAERAPSAFFIGRVTAWTTDGVQRLRLRDDDGRIVAERVAPKGQPLGGCSIREWVNQHQDVLIGAVRGGS